MAFGTKTFETVAAELGVPADRIGLVKRNLELKQKLESACSVILSTGETFHEAFSHQGAFETCQAPTCSGSRELSKLHKP